MTLLGNIGHHDHHHHHDHVHDTAVTSVSIVSEGTLDLDEVSNFYYCTFNSVIYVRTQMCVCLVNSCVSSACTSLSTVL